jgi:AbiU2
VSRRITENRMHNDYTYSVAQCDVAADKHGALQSYRDKRRLWLSWIDLDEHHAIWRVLSSMVWTDVSFKTLTQLAINDENNALHNTLLAQALINGHVATQVLAIRRLMDNGNTNIISLRRLVKDMRRNFHLFTRENYVCFDGLPYDYEAALRKEMLEHVGKGLFWGQTSGPGAHGTSRMAHQQFDRLACIDPTKRSREDRLPLSLLATIERWLDESGADELAQWSHAYLAHAGGPEARRRIADLLVTADKITDAIKALARVTEAISAWLLFAGGRSNSLMPVAQFNPFEKLDKSIMYTGGEDDAYEVWHRLSDDANRYLDGVEDELIGRAKSGTSYTP